MWGVDSLGPAVLYLQSGQLIAMRIQLKFDRVRERNPNLP